MKQKHLFEFRISIEESRVNPRAPSLSKMTQRAPSGWMVDTFIRASTAHDAPLLELIPFIDFAKAIKAAMSGNYHKQEIRVAGHHVGSFSLTRKPYYA